MDPVALSTLAVAVIGGLSQLLQIYFDYKRDQHHKTDHIYTSSWQSNCCVNVNQEQTENE